MVMHVSSFGRNGVHDFILIRATAVVMALFCVYMVGFFAITPEITYAIWVEFWGRVWNKVFALLTLGCVLVHAWIGLWQVLTDYIKSTFFRGVLQFSVVILLIVYLLTGFSVLWGV